MNKPIIFIVYISIACCVGFIGGVFFDKPYKQYVVKETISQYNRSQMLMSWYQMIVFDQLAIKDLKGVNSLQDVNSL